MVIVKIIEKEVDFMKRKFLLCPTCENIIEMIKDSGVTPSCCGSAMTILEANKMEAAVEKHVPVIEVDGDVATVRVGEVAHPMMEEHYIEWIYLKTDKKVMRVDLKPDDEATAVFTLDSNEKVIEAYAYCNLHGLWVKETI